MMSLEAIRAMSDEAAAEAAEDNEVPYVLDEPEEALRFRMFPFPNLGSYVPPGWKLTEKSFFVDSSGFGQPGEAALTVDQFKRALYEYAKKHPSHGYAIVEEGQFQLYVGAFKPVKS